MLTDGRTQKRTPTSHPAINEINIFIYNKTPSENVFPRDAESSYLIEAGENVTEVDRPDSSVGRKSER